jgi:outer membrane lipoprotein-sorting protein
MNRALMVFGSILALAAPMPGAANTAQTNLSAAQIVDKNIAARGGLQAWRAVHSLSEEGKMGVGGNQRATLQVPMPNQEGKTMGGVRPKEEAQLPFVMDLERPRKSRFELKFKAQTAVQVYDGTNGWKLRPYLNRREVEPYSQDELKIASMQTDLDGPLIDYASKGIQVDLDGIEKVEDRDCYKLKLTMRDGRTIHDWIDAQSFLEAKIEGQPRRLDGKIHPVEVYYRDYRTVSGLQIPFVMETKVLPVETVARGFKDPPVPTERITITKVVVNPKLDPSLFLKPEVVTASNGH